MTTLLSIYCRSADEKSSENWTVIGEVRVQKTDRHPFTGLFPGQPR